VVDCTGLENRQRATFREFESHRLRQHIQSLSAAMRSAKQAKSSPATDHMQG
jgi:hypothetical protein